MSNPFDSIQAPVRGLHEQAGWPGQVHSFTPADEDDGGEWWDDSGGSTGDGWDEHTEDVTIRVSFGTSPAVIRGAGGREITGDAAITVDPSEHPGDKAAFTAGAGESVRATEITDLEGDQQPRYRVLRVENPHNGLLILDAELLT